MIKTFSVRVAGKVQGVFFRASAKQQADDLGLSGFVRNQPDGSVYIEVEGEEDQLEEFLYWCKRGPQHARVDSIDITEIDFKGFEDFEVTR
jgi:acylphosphatase